MNHVTSNAQIRLSDFFDGILFFIPILLLMINPNTSFGQIALGPVSRSLGGGGRATVSGIEGAYLNPASLPFYKEYTVGGFYTLNQSQGSIPSRSWSAAFIDNDSEAVLPAALSYTDTQFATDASATSFIGQSSFQLSAAKILNDNVALGVALNTYQQKIVGAADAPMHFNGNLGILWYPIEEVGFGLVSYNVRSDYNSFILPRTAFGSNFVYKKDFRFRFDVVHEEMNNPDQKYIYQLGLESKFERQFYMRMGYRREDIYSKSFVGAGFGWDGPKIALDYGYEKNVMTSDEFSHCVDLRVFF